MFEAVGPGVAHVTATVRGVTSAAQTITVIPPQPMLVHRYSFNEPAASPAAGLPVHDSVGVQDGLVFGQNTAFTGSQISLTPDNTIYTNDKNNYVELPAGLISSYDAVTLDIWFTASANRMWARIYDFGYQNTAGSGLGYLDAPVFDNSTPNVLAVDGNDGVATVTARANRSLDNATTHLTVVYDKPGTSSIRIYTNGLFAGSATLAATNIVPRNINDINCYLGHSQYVGDPAFSGSYDEVRIYSGALSDAQVAAINTAGKDSVATTLPPRVLMTPSGANLVFSWPTTSGFTLKRSTAGVVPLSAYSGVGGETVSGALTTVTIPAPTTTTFYLLSNP